MSHFSTPRRLANSVLTGALAALMATTAALAQPPQRGYDDRPPAYDAPPPPRERIDPDRPPPGYTEEDARRDASARAQDEDRAYARAAERWAEENCYRQQANREAGGAIVGGILGAIIGSNLAGGRSRGAGAVVGGALGAVAGSAVARNSSAGPGCPDGYALREQARPFAYGSAVVVYDAPEGYNPWFWDGGRWIYRPYAYHRYWHEHYGVRGRDDGERRYDGEPRRDRDDRDRRYDRDDGDRRR